MKATKVLLNITSFFCFIYFALYIFTLVFIPIGIYCFLAGKRFAYKADHLGDNYKLTNINFKKYVIFNIYRTVLLPGQFLQLHLGR